MLKKIILLKIMTFGIILQFISTIHAMERGTVVLVWEPEGEIKYGHASVNTGTYHMSLWPESNKSITNNNIPGCLHYHQSYDRANIKDRPPTEQYKLNISTKHVNEAYEEVLDYNDLTKDKFTIEAADEIIEKNKIQCPELKVLLPKTRYSFIGKNYYDKEFYKYQQSCTTFSIALLRSGGLKLEELGLFESKGVITVSNFSKKVSNHSEN